VKKLILILAALLLFVMPLFAEEVIIDDESIRLTKENYEFGLRLLTQEDITELQKEELIKDFADALTKLWVLENATVKNGMFTLYLDGSDMFIDKQGNLYFEAESMGYIKIGNDEYNLEGDLVILTEYEALIPEPESKSILQIAPKMGVVVITDLKRVDFDVVFFIQLLKIKKINTDIGIGFRSGGLRVSYQITDNFDIGIYGGIGYPREDLKWRPVVGLGAAFKF